MEIKHLSYIANDVIRRCSQKLETPVDALVEEFESTWNPKIGDYSRKLLEFCSTKALNYICNNIEEQINDQFFSRFSFDVMLAWEKPKSADEEQDSVSECVAKEKEEKNIPTKLNKEHDEVPLFYSDIMPLLVDHGPSVGESAFVWFATLVPLIADVVNGKFSFETLTATTGKRLYFPAYDKFLKEIDKCIKHLQKQAKPAGVELEDDEFILHVEGIATSPRVVRHIGGTSWPGRLTITNYALYFEASGVISYEDAIKLDLSKATDQSVKAAATGPWGAPLFDKAIIYESSELQESVVLEFPEMTSSTRRDHWLALIQEIMLLHRFLPKYNVDSPVQVWEMHARTILGIIRLHAAREMLRISPPTPHSFLIFSLFEELPKGDFVLDALSESVKNVNSGHPCSASSILRSLNVSQACALCLETEEITEKGETLRAQSDNLSSLESAIDQVREEAKEVVIAKDTAEGLKEEGISDSAAVLIELLKPLKNLLFPQLQKVLTWEKPGITVMVTGISLLIVYEEWIGKAIAALLLWMVAKMIQARRNQVGSKYNKVVVCTASDKSTVENIVSAQHGLRSAHEILQLTNISILKIWSILVSKAPKHTNTVMIAMSLSAIILAVVAFKFIIMGIVLYIFAATSGLGKRMEIEQGSSKGNRRLKEWWESIPVIPVEVLDKMPESTS